MLQAGSILQQRYRIEKVIGQGGMGAVYLASDTRLPRQWAVKEMTAGDADEPLREAARQSFLAESRILSSLDHPNLPHVADFFEENDKHYLVMDYIQGETLEARLNGELKMLPLSEALDLGLQLSKVLSYLHNLPTPIIFRDLKPGNVILTPTGSGPGAAFRAKLIDFGIARFFRVEAAHDTRALGTPGYAAPEQYGKGQSDPRTDVYALGATLHHCLSGKDPSDTPFQFESLRHVRSDVSEGLDRLILRAVSLKPQERFQSAADLGQALEAVRRDPSFIPHLPKSSKTAELVPPAATPVPITAGLTSSPPPPLPASPVKDPQPCFEPSLVKIGQLRHGQDARTEVTLQGSVKGRLSSDARWLKVSPRKVKGTNQVVTLHVLSNKLPDAGLAAAHLRLDGQPPVTALRIEVDVVPRRRSRLAVPAAVFLCFLSLFPAVGWLACPLMLLVALGTPRSLRSSLWWFFWFSTAATVIWTAVVGIGVEIYYHTDAPAAARSAPQKAPSRR